MKQQMLEIGQIVNTFGVKGQIKVVPFTDNIKRFDDLKVIYIEKKGNLDKYEICEVKYHKNMVILKLNEIDTMEKAEKLKESYIKINREDAIPLEENTYFIVDLIGLEVITEKDEVVGELIDIYNTGSNDIYVVKNLETGKQILLPAIKEVIKKIDIENKKIIVNLIDGLE